MFSYTVGRSIRNPRIWDGRYYFPLDFPLDFSLNTSYNSTVNRLAILLHLYQPVTQSERKLREIVESSYIPLIRLLKNRKELKLTLNIPLSLLEQLDRSGYTKIISDIKFLVAEEKVELTGSAAYHPLLTKLPKNLIQSEIILNEYGVGYYFGRTSGFEGEKAILINDLNGFFPPELAINEEVLKTLNDLSYNWVLVNPTSTGDAPGVYKYGDSECLILSRNSGLSDALAFARGIELPLLPDLSQEKNMVLAMDAETFGHHNPDGFYVLTKFLDLLVSQNIELQTASEFVEESVDESEVISLDAFKESTWAEFKGNDPYVLWKGTDVQKILWDLQEKFIKAAKIEVQDHPDMENSPIWKEKIPEDVAIELLLHRSLQSDKFWWAAEIVMGETLLHDFKMIHGALAIYSDLASLLNNDKLLSSVADAGDKIRKAMETNGTNNTTTLLSTS